MTIITVGFTLASAIQAASIAAAVTIARPGDTIDLNPALTYTNDIPVSITNGITIQGYGGMAHLVATAPPSNGKAWFVTSGNVTLKNLDVSGVHVADLNGAPVRYQGGNLNLSNVYFHNNDEGLLAPADPNGSIFINSSEFAFNGSNGYSHNVYIDNVGKVVVSNSFIHDVLGHGSEFRSRGANTTIINSRIMDLGNADNYTLDLPAGGNVVLSNDVLQKIAGATNPFMLHFGGGGVVPEHVPSSLSISNTTFLNYAANAYGLLDLDPTVTPIYTNDASFGLLAGHILSTSKTPPVGWEFLASAPDFDLTQPWLPMVFQPPPVGLPLLDLADANAPSSVKIPSPGLGAFALGAMALAIVQRKFRTPRAG